MMYKFDTENGQRYTAGKMAKNREAIGYSYRKDEQTDLNAIRNVSDASDHSFSNRSSSLP